MYFKYLHTDKQELGRAGDGESGSHETTALSLHRLTALRLSCLLPSSSLDPSLSPLFLRWASDISLAPQG